MHKLFQHHEKINNELISTEGVSEILGKRFGLQNKHYLEKAVDLSGEGQDKTAAFCFFEKGGVAIVIIEQMNGTEEQV